MKHLAKLLLATILSLNILTAYAACTSSTIMSDGKIVTCTTCCAGNHCNTTCF